MTDADWQALLDDDPADPQRRLEYADWLAEQGLEVEAEAQRWLGRNRRCPDQLSPNAWHWYIPRSQWHNLKARNKRWIKRWRKAAVAEGLEQFLGEGNWDTHTGGRCRVSLEEAREPFLGPGTWSYPSREAAEAALLAAWKEAKAKGWRP